MVDNSLSRELRFILLTSSKNMTVEQEKTAMEIYSSGFDLEQFYNLLNRHSLTPIVYRNFGNLKINKDPIFSYAANNAQNYTLKSMRLVKMLAEVLKLFEDNNIAALSIKGPALAQLIYGNVSYRQSGDLDILIKETDFERSIEVLEQAGFNSLDKITTPRRKKNYFKYGNNHHFEMYRDNIMVEVHWRTDAFSGTSYDDLISDNEVLKMCGVDVRIPDRYSYIYYLINHGARHGYAALRWLVDINELLSLEENFDYKRLYNIFVEHKTEHLFFMTLLLLDKFELRHVDLSEYETSSSIDVARKLCELDFATIIEMDSDIRFAKWNTFHYAFEDEMVERGIVTPKDAVFDFRPTITEYQLIDLPDYLYFLYYPIRLFYWLWRKTPFYKGNKKTRTVASVVERHK